MISRSAQRRADKPGRHAHRRYLAGHGAFAKWINPRRKRRISAT
jgi:hypothetical protein